MPDRFVAVGTAKGLFTYRHTAGQWKLAGPFLSGWEVSSLLLQPNGGTPHILAGTVHYAYGATIRKSVDGGETFTQLEGRPAYPEGSSFKLTRIWQIAALDKKNPDKLFAGVDEAGLFKSDDGGKSWSELSSLTGLPSRSSWNPGAGGLCLHTILIDPNDSNRMWVGISAVGVFKTTDGGKTWTPSNAGLSSVATGSDEPSAIYCIHKMTLHPSNPNKLFMQFHGGVYASEDGGANWQRRENGLPGNFGFPMVVLSDGSLMIAPLQADEHRFFKDGKMAVYKSTDEAKTWTPRTKGLPDEPVYTGVLRDAMCVDSADGTYLATTGGDVFASLDQGESWQRLPGRLPRALMVRAMVV